MTLPPDEVTVLLAEFDEQGTLSREEEYTWYNASQLASCLTELGVPEAEAGKLAEELIEGVREEERGLPQPGWVPRGCLGAFTLGALTVGVWLVGLAFLVWLVATRVF